MTLCARTLGRLLLLIVAGSILGCADTGRPAIPFTLQDTMDGFVAALRGDDPAALADYFPQRGEWTLLSTIGGPEARSQHTGAETRDALQTRTGLYDSLVESEGGGDTLRDYAQMNGDRPWQATGPRQFVPQAVFDDPQRLYVRWRQERERWVIDAIGVPFS